MENETAFVHHRTYFLWKAMEKYFGMPANTLKIRPQSCLWRLALVHAHEKKNCHDGIMAMKETSCSSNPSVLKAWGSPWPNFHSTSVWKTHSVRREHAWKLHLIVPGHFHLQKCHPKRGSPWSMFDLHLSVVYEKQNAKVREANDGATSSFKIFFQDIDRQCPFQVFYSKNIDCWGLAAKIKSLKLPFSQKRRFPKL